MDYLAYRQQLKLTGKPEPVKVNKPIAHFSKKRAKAQVEYVKIVKDMMEVSDRCELKVIGVCTGKAEGLHHMRKRNAYLLDKRFLKRACNSCNNFAEQFPLEAIKLGISLSKFS